MRVRIRKLQTISRATQTTFAVGDLTAPISTGPSPAKPAPLSWWRRLVARLRPRLAPPPVPRPVQLEAVEGTLVEFLGWEGEGEDRRISYNPFPEGPDNAVDYDKPIVLLLDSEKIGDRRRLWYSSPVSLLTCDREGLPVRAETRSSEYALTWLDKPMPREPDSGPVKG